MKCAFCGRFAYQVKTGEFHGRWTCHNKKCTYFGWYVLDIRARDSWLIGDNFPRIMQEYADYKEKTKHINKGQY